MVQFYIVHSTMGVCPLTCLPLPQSLLQSIGPNILSRLTQRQFLTHTAPTEGLIHN